MKSKRSKEGSSLSVVANRRANGRTRVHRYAEIYSSTDENVLFQEIVDTINHIETLEEEEVPFEKRIVTSSEALLGCDNVLAYIAQKNLNVDYSVINTLSNLRKEISQTSIELARQL